MQMGVRVLRIAASLLLGASALGAPGPVQAVANSELCATCHSNAPAALAMRDAAGHGIAPYDLWRSTMMANASRDPLWRAVVSVEVAATPSRQLEIETKCLTCHAPMAREVGFSDHGTGSLMHQLDCVDATSELARDGVSCTICHGIRADGLGTPASFSAGFQLDGERLFGPHRQPFPMPMRRFSGFTPTHGEQVLESALCGSCHTVETHALSPEGEDQGVVFLEQSPYLEWRNSIFDTERPSPGRAASSCQDCHAPKYDSGGRALLTRIARNPMGSDFPRVVPREPFGRHLFVGGNTLVLSMLRDHGEALRTKAPREAFDATIEATREQLGRSASLAIRGFRKAADGLELEVIVSNHSGHKFPTGHPVRRAWLHVVVRDAQERVVFESGAHDEAGRLMDMSGAVLASELAGGPVEPHREVVRAGNEVACFEAVMADVEGHPTHLLMRGASWYRDNRLLPAGWSGEHADALRTFPVGVEDVDFIGGSDRVRFEIAAQGEGPYSVEAELLYQTLGARWAAELARWQTEEVKAFFELYEQADRTPERIARVRAKSTDIERKHPDVREADIRVLSFKATVPTWDRFSGRSRSPHQLHRIREIEESTARR